MKIMRVINRVPVEIELTSAEEAEIYAKLNSERALDSLLYTLEFDADNDDPDTDDPYSAKMMLHTLNRCPSFAEKVAMEYEKFRDTLRSSDADVDCAKDAYRYILKSWEVCK